MDDLIKEYLEYDPTSKTGLRWKQDSGAWGIKGNEAFTGINGWGYYNGTLKRNHFYAHQIVMFLNTGEWGIAKEKIIDHIDDDKLNNNINNLRFVTPKQNQWINKAKEQLSW